MSNVSVRQTHTLSADEARERLKDLENDLQKFGVKLDWRGNTAKIRGTGVSGSVDTDSGAVEVKLKLGLIARAAGVDPVRLRSSLERRLVETFGE